MRRAQKGLHTNILVANCTNLSHLGAACKVAALRFNQEADKREAFLGETKWFVQVCGLWALAHTLVCTVLSHAIGNQCYPEYNAVDFKIYFWIPCDPLNLPTN